MLQTRETSYRLTNTAGTRYLFIPRGSTVEVVRVGQNRYLRRRTYGIAAARKLWRFLTLNCGYRF